MALPTKPWEGLSTHFSGQTILENQRPCRELTLFAVLLAVMLAGCGHTKAKAEGAKSCIRIQQSIPEFLSVDDAGNSTEPVLITIDARGETEDLKRGDVIYAEDGVQIKAIPIGDLHPGVQTVTIGPGLHTTSSSALFDMTLPQPDGTEGSALSITLNSLYSVPPVAPPSQASIASGNGENTDQPIVTIAPGVDRQEAESIRQFRVDEVGTTYFDGFIKLTTGDDANSMQTITLHGVNFKDGMPVRFRTTKGGQRVEATSPLMNSTTIATLEKPDYPPSNPSSLMSATVVVPVKITHDAKGQFSVRTVHAESSDSCK
jgi:hypothetical protein